MAVCQQCGGFLKITVRSPTGCGIRQVDCPCTQTQTPGKVPNQYAIEYPPEVIQALQQAGQLQRQALTTRALTAAQHPGSG